MLEPEGLDQYCTEKLASSTTIRLDRGTVPEAVSALPRETSKLFSSKPHTE